jgi:hypothetical protein
VVEPLRMTGQVMLYAAFAALVGYLSNSPAYVHVNPRDALIRLSFTHPGERKGECRRLTPEEIAKLPPNMRRPMDCPRERVSLLVELELDGKLLYRGMERPVGIARDGASTVYQRFVVPPGSHHLLVRMRDSAREQGFDYQRSAEIHLAPEQNFVVDFDKGGFVFR